MPVQEFQRSPSVFFDNGLQLFENEPLCTLTPGRDLSMTNPKAVLWASQDLSFERARKGSHEDVSISA